MKFIFNHNKLEHGYIGSKTVILEIKLQAYCITTKTKDKTCLF
jgi:hypothetical protein